MPFFEELKRRNVIKVGIAYAVVAWLVLQFSDVILNNIEAPGWVFQAIMLALGIGFVLSLFFAWAFEMTPDGLKKEKDVDRSKSITAQTGRKLDFIIIAVLVLALGYFAWDKFIAGPLQDTDNVQDASQSESGAQAEPDLGAAKSIAVLPFTNRSPNPDDIYFTDGVHDDLLTQLAKIGAFSVISRTSVMEYRDTEKNLKQIGAELGVANVMEGAVQRAGNRVRINVQLIDANTDEHLWAEIYDRELTTENLFDIQSEIAQAIAAALHATLTESEIALVSDVPTDSIEAYELYMQARPFASGQTIPGYNTAIEMLKNALDIDPQFKLAWLDLSLAHLNKYWVSGNLVERQKSRDALDQARAIDSDFPELYLAEGGYWYWGHLDYDRAISNLRKAITLIPGNAEAHMRLGWALRRAGEWEQALTAMGESVRLDPRSTYNWAEYGQTHIIMHRYEEGRQKLETATSLDPQDFWTKSLLAILAINTNGDTETALRLLAGSQYSEIWDVALAQMNVLLLSGDLEAALQQAKEYPEAMEVRRDSIILRESWEAEALYFMGRHDKARATARAGLERLQVLRNELGADYRTHMAQAHLMVFAGDRDQLSAQVKLARDSEPADALSRPINDYSYARILAVAGLADEAIAMLDPLFLPPSEVSVHWVDLDPAFNDIREQARFVEMMDKYR